MLNKDNLKDHNINTACVATRGLHYAYGLQKNTCQSCHVCTKGHVKCLGHISYVKQIESCEESVLPWNGVNHF